MIIMIHKDYAEINQKINNSEKVFKTDLICPFLSDSQVLTNCLGKACGYFDICFNEMNTNKTSVTKFLMSCNLIILILLTITMLIK